jgi:hypothetical protein
MEQCSRIARRCSEDEGGDTLFRLRARTTTAAHQRDPRDAERRKKYRIARRCSEDEGGDTLFRLRARTTTAAHQRDPRDAEHRRHRA